MITITISDSLEARLKPLVARYNADTKADLTVAEWVDLHLHELAVQDDLAAELPNLQQQREKAWAEEVAGLRGRLIAELRAEASAPPAPEGGAP
jgi:hypothetical protein